MYHALSTCTCTPYSTTYWWCTLSRYAQPICCTWRTPGLCALGVYARCKPRTNLRYFSEVTCGLYVTRGGGGGYHLLEHPGVPPLEHPSGGTPSGTPPWDPLQDPLYGDTPIWWTPWGWPAASPCCCSRPNLLEVRYSITTRARVGRSHTRTYMMHNTILQTL